MDDRMIRAEERKISGFGNSDSRVRTDMGVYQKRNMRGMPDAVNSSGYFDAMNRETVSSGLKTYSSPRMGPNPTTNGDNSVNYADKTSREPSPSHVDRFQKNRDVQQSGIYEKETSYGAVNERVVSSRVASGQANYTRMSYNQVVSAANELNTVSSEMAALLDDVKRLFSRVGENGVWSGTAAASTKEMFDALSAKFPQFYEAINDCSKYLSQVVANYQAVDNTIRRG